ncbi:unnamed protein product [Cutaneotrichosporon oleaginosum]
MLTLTLTLTLTHAHAHLTHAPHSAPHPTLAHPRSPMPAHSPFPTPSIHSPPEARCTPRADNASDPDALPSKRTVTLPTRPHACQPILPPMPHNMNHA